MNDLLQNNLDAVKSSFWQKTKERVFSREVGFPFWTLLGPIASFFTLGCFTYVQPSLISICGLGFVISQMLILRFKKIGLILSLLLFIYPFFVVSTLSNGMNFLYSLSTFLSFYVLYASLSEISGVTSSLQKNLLRLEEENALWPKRFETLNHQYQEIQTDFEELQTESERLITDHEKELSQLAELVTASSQEAALFQKRIDQLYDENLLRSKVQHQSHDQIIELQEEVESLRLKVAQAAAPYESKINDLHHQIKELHLSKSSFKELKEHEIELLKVELLEKEDSFAKKLTEVTAPFKEEIATLQIKLSDHHLQLTEATAAALEHQQQEIAFLKSELVEKENSFSKKIEEISIPLQSKIDELYEINLSLLQKEKDSTASAELFDEIEFLTTTLDTERESFHNQMTRLEQENKTLQEELATYSNSAPAADTPKKGERKKMRVTDDELLFGFYGLSHAALENVIKYKENQPEEVSEGGLF